jgi:hypothetical protein
MKVKTNIKAGLFVVENTGIGIGIGQGVGKNLGEVEVEINF